MRTDYSIPHLDPIPYEDLIQRWLAWSADASREAGYPEDATLTRENYISNRAPILRGRIDPDHWMGSTVLLIDILVQDELISFQLMAIYDSFNNLSALMTEVDTTWFTIYTNEGN